MKQHINRQVRVVYSTLVGGLLFLLPVLVLGLVAVQIGPYVLSAIHTIGDWLPGEGRWTYVLVALIFVCGTLIVCLVAGLLARWSLSRAISRQFERHLTLLFPRYAVYKDQIAGNLGGEFAAERFRAVLVPEYRGKRIGFEVERSDETVVVYIPGSPDSWSGYVAFFTTADVEPLPADMPECLVTLETLGRGGLSLLNGSAPVVKES